MGKVYEALNRAESRTQNPSCADILLDYTDIEMEGIDVEDASETGAHYPAPGEHDYRDGHNYRDDRKARNDREDRRFNFLKYSLGANSFHDREQTKRDTASRAIVRRSQAQPSREITLDFSRMDPHLAAFDNFDRQASDQYNKLALTLISRAAERGFKRVLVTSAHHGEGRTTVTLNLACALARARQRVLVVDCDLMQPSVMRMLGLRCDVGMAEAFSGDMAPGAAAVRILPFGFNVLPTRRPVENPVELLAAPGFWKMLQMFDADHDFILFDSSPLLEIGDSSLLARFTDTTLMVVRAGRVSSSEMAKAIVGFSQSDMLGVVVNRAQA